MRASSCKALGNVVMINRKSRGWRVGAAVTNTENSSESGFESQHLRDG